MKLLVTMIYSTVHNSLVRYLLHSIYCYTVIITLLLLGDTLLTKIMYVYIYTTM